MPEVDVFSFAKEPGQQRHENMFWIVIYSKRVSSINRDENLHYLIEKTIVIIKILYGFYS